MPIAINGYLTEAKLATALQQLVGDHWVGCQVRLSGSLYRWDMAFQQGGSQVLVEFDGDEHYCNSLKIMVDRKKDSIALAQKKKVVRVPYWIQLTSVTAQHYFGISADIEQDFQHGFITTKIFPASFCELGIERFKSEFEDLPLEVREAVVGSLRDRIQRYGLEYVLPSSLRNLVLP